MVSEDGQALLTFGVAALINALFLPAAMSLRRPANWASPEELESGKFVKAPEADVWAFGMTALELFTRKPPFHCIESEEDVKARVLRDPPNRPSEEETCSRLTDGWWDICLPCWQRNPSSRPDMTEIASKIKLMIQCAVSVTLHPETGTTDNTSKSSIAGKSNPKKPPSDQANDKLEYPKQHPPLSKGDTP
ncbi:hypothetical protein SCLCIDRAFT_632160 [Scleroderma citrinum Foug A]|uniref:Protein kinase domain-containing protein n=1 Tax=Scleroderma citrinum Foug A TaxID=1036808 RepID=A0A0C3E7P7_9AGAM|nr:hypothetical protein SCLCIDRAFT_632160 [Scleroderma citrinum Foug A]